MKKVIISLLVLIPALLHAAGIKGTITNEHGVPKKGVAVKVSDYNVTTTTDSNGEFFLELPDSSKKTNVSVFVNGDYVTTAKIPTSGHSTVDVIIKK